MDDYLSNDDLLASVLDSDIKSATDNAFGVLKDNYRQLVAIGNLTSNSMQEKLHTCPRYFQIMKLQADNEGEYERESNCHFAFGHAVGAGVATFDQTKDLRKAIWAAFLAWNMDLFAEVIPKKGRPNPLKSFTHAIWALYVYASFCEDELDMDEYEVVKTEATIGVDFENGYFYSGHIDELLRHRDTGRYKVKENKTVSESIVDPAKYANADQALSYAVVIDSLGAADYAVQYTVYSSTEQRWMVFEFVKSPLAKVEWLQDQAFIASTIEAYSEKDFFPKRGASCYLYGRQCEHFQNCDFDSQRVFGKTYKELPTIQSLEDLDAIEHVDFKATWSGLVRRQKERLNEI
jgi:hypothetical protein